MRLGVTSFAVSCILFIAMPGAAFAGCADSVALLAKRVGLITEAGSLASDPKAPLGPGDTLVTLENPALTARTSLAFDALKAPAADSRDKADRGFPANVARAGEALEDARTALNQGDTAACEDAVSMGQAAAMAARNALR